MGEILLIVFGATKDDTYHLEHELSDIFGSPAETDATLSAFGSAISFIVELAKTNLAEVANQVVALMRRMVGMRIELDVNGTKLIVDGATSPEQLVPLLQLALQQRQQPSRG